MHRQKKAFHTNNFHNYLMFYVFFKLIADLIIDNNIYIDPLDEKIESFMRKHEHNILIQLNHKASLSVRKCLYFPIYCVYTQGNKFSSWVIET